MAKHQLRLLLSAGGALGLMIVSMFVIDWFRISIDGLDLMGMNDFKLDLRSASACMPNGSCQSVSLSKFQGFYPTASVTTFYTSCVLLLILAVQTGTRLFGNQASEALTRLGYLFAVLGFLAAGATGYLFQPETASGNLGSIGLVSVTVTRTWGPAMHLLGAVLAMVALHYAGAEETFDSLATGDAKRLPVTPVRANIPAYKPVRAAAIPFASIPIDGKPSAPKIDTRLSANDAAIEAAPAKPRAVSSIPLDQRLSANEGAEPDGPAISRTTSSADTAPDAFARMMPSVFDARLFAPGHSNDDLELPLPPAVRSAASPFVMESDLPKASKAEPKPEPAKIEPAKPELHVRTVLSFATSTVALSSDGVDAKLDSGATKLVAWTEVVGVVARRLPPDPPYDGETFVDLVSTAGSTLRILPWTELTGEALVGGELNPIERARAFVQLVASRCPAAKLDAATRTFLGSRGLAAQLPDAAILAQHDDRLS